MGKRGFIETIFDLSNWILRLIYINLLWIFFSLIGLIIFGFFPSSLAMFTVIRKLIQKEPNITIFNTFWSVYRKEFLNSNVLGSFFFITGLILYYDLLFLQHVKFAYLQFLYIPVLMLVFLYIITFLYFFPIYVHFDVKGFKIIKNAFFISIIAPVETIILVVGLLFIVYLIIALRGSVILFSGSLPCLFIMFLAKYAFHKFEKKRTKLNNEILEK